MHHHMSIERMYMRSWSDGRRIRLLRCRLNYFKELCKRFCSAVSTSGKTLDTLSNRPGYHMRLVLRHPVRRFNILE